MKKIDSKKVVLIGTGFVGMSMAYSLVNTGGVDELVLIDINKDKSVGEAMDLNHGMPYSKYQMDVKAGDYSDCKNSDIIVITAGFPQKEGESRLDLAARNIVMMKEITANIMASGFDGIIVVAGNPVDILTYEVWKASGLPPQKVIGTGTMLDTARLRYLIGKHLDISSKNIHAYILGEHGDSSFVPWEHTYVGVKKLEEYMDGRECTLCELEAIHKDVKEAAYEIIARKKATYYAIGMTLNRLVEAILNDEHAIFTLSCYLNGQYKQDDVYIGVPAIVTSRGIKEIIELPLNKDDQAKMDQSVALLKEVRI